MKKEKVKKPIVNAALGKILRENKEKLGYSVRFVAHKADCQFSYLASMERGEVARPKIKVIEFLADMYGLDKDGLVNMCGKITSDVYWKIVHNPKLLPLIRDMEV